MNYKALVLFLVCSVLAGSGLTGSVRAGDGYKATHPGTSAKSPSPAQITPCAPGVVYVKLKAGSTVFQTSRKGEITQSIAPATPFAKVIATLMLRTVAPFDPAPIKDPIALSLGIDRMYCIYYSNTSIDPHTALKMLDGTGEVECGSPRYLFPLSFTPNDPDISQQYALTKMNVFSAWSKTTGDTSIVIADVDNAINIDHEDLKNEIKYNWGEVGTDSKERNKETNGVDDDGDGYIDNYEGWDVCGNVNIGTGAQPKPNNDPRPRVDSASHGTHTAGCILATGNNALGIAGVAYGCRLLPVKSAGSDVNDVGGGYEGIHYASNHGARITNCSWGGFVTSDDTAYANAFVAEAVAHNDLIVAAAGNFGTSNDPNSINNFNYEYPADAPGVLSVGATDQNNLAANFSDFGHSVSVWAPGVGIISSDYPGNGSYSAEDGTSFSSPLTAGAAGIIASLHPTWSPSSIANLLIQTADNVINPADQADYWGIVDLGNAINSLLLVGSDSLGPAGIQKAVKITFKNTAGNQGMYSVTMLPTYGADPVSVPVSIGPFGPDSTATGQFLVTRSGIYSQGMLNVRFAISNDNGFSDTISAPIPLSVIPGFVPDIPGTYGSSIDRVSATAAWAAFGQAASTGQILSANFAQEQASQWIDTTILNDGANPPYCVTGIDSNTAFFGSGPPGGTASVISTTDGGADFNEVDVSTFAAFVNTIHFFDPLNGIFIGDPVSSKWGIGITNDGGQTWQQMTKPPTAGGTIASWNNSASWVGDHGWFGTNSQQIYRTTNRGQTWASATTKPHQNALGLAFADDAQHGIACFLPANTTGDTAMAVSADSGHSWQTLTTLPIAGIAPGSVQFVPQSNTAILTSNKGVFRTSDFGVTWTPIGIPVSFDANQASISIWRGTDEFVVSINSATSGVATYTEAAPLNAVSEQKLPSFDLVIYPNPMASSATMTFTLPASDHIHAALYDALGRSVLQVVDANYTAGVHIETFDASHLMPGTYYLHLQTTSGVQQTRAVTIVP